MPLIRKIAPKTSANDADLVAERPGRAARAPQSLDQAAKSTRERGDGGDHDELAADERRDERRDDGCGDPALPGTAARRYATSAFAIR